MDKSWNNIYAAGFQLNEYPYEWVIASTKKIINNPNKKNVLDLGCGNGNHINFFLKFKFKFITAIDASEVVIKSVFKKFRHNKKIEIINDNISTHNFRVNFYDLILDRMTITHNKKKEIKVLVNNLYTSLKKDGYIFSMCFSQKHNEYKKLNKNGISFNNIYKTKGITTSFMSLNDIKDIYKKFKIISIVEEIKNDVLTGDSQAFWYLILKKND